MEKTNRMFNLLSDDTKKKCVELDYLDYDEFRTEEFAKKNYIEMEKTGYWCYVFSPYLAIPTINEMGEDDLEAIPGTVGEWTDDEDSYTILLKPVQNNENSNYKYNIKIFRYSDLSERLCDLKDVEAKFISSVYNNQCMISIIDQEARDKLNSIRENLSSAVEEAINMY